MLRSLTTSLALAALLAPRAVALTQSPASASRPGYRFEEFSSPDWRSSEAHGLAENGTVLGSVETLTSGSPVLWRPTRIDRLDRSPFSSISLIAVNSLGDVVLQTYQLKSSVYRWSNGRYTPLRFPGSDIVFANDLSEAGVTVGHAVDAPIWRPCYWSAAGEAHAIPMPAYGTGTARAVNASGEIVGVFALLGADGKAFHFDGQTTTLIDPLPGDDFATALDIADDGSIAVNSGRTGGSGSTVFTTCIHRPGGVEILAGPYPGEGFFSQRVNGSGHVLGKSGDFGTYEWFLYVDGHYHSLDDLAPTPPAIPMAAEHLNERGQIAGGYWSFGSTYAWLLTPCVGNFDRDPDIDSDDIDMFYRAFQAGYLRADIDENGVVDAIGEELFLKGWIEGC